MALTKVKAGNILLTTPAASSNDVTPATTQYVTTALANLADSAPSTLNTLNELAAALGDDANFSTTVTNSIATKLPLAGGTLTGAVVLGTASAQGNQTSPALRFGPSTYRLGMYTTSEGAFIENKNGDDGINFLVKTAGQAMRIDGGTGKVGIGTTTPNLKLHVEEDGADQWIADFKHTHADAYGLRIDLSGTTSSTRYALGVYTGGGTGLFLRNNGNVGIGTSSPSNKLEISGTGGTRLKVENTDTNWAGLDLTAGGNQANYVFFNDNSAERARITVYDGNDMSFSTGSSPSEKMRIASDGVVYFGPNGSTADPRINRHSNGYDYINSGNGRWLKIGANSGHTNVAFQDGSGGVTVFETAGSERMRIASNGDVHFKCGSSQPSASVVGWEYHDTGSAYPWVKQSVGGTGGLTHYQFYNPNGAVGQIFTSGSSTTYSASSDYRLKENVEYTWDATTLLKQLKPCKFNFIKEEDGAKPTLQGFLAHEVSNIVPGAVRYTKDAVDSEGEPEYQQMDPAKLVPLLVKTIQELEARIATLEG